MKQAPRITKASKVWQSTDILSPIRLGRRKVFIFGGQLIC